MKFLLDTSVLSEPVRTHPDRRFMRRLRANAAEVAISSVTWHEAVPGLLRMPQGMRKEAVRAYLFETIAPTTPILPYDARAAEVHGAERARLERLGRAPTFAGGQIAAVALANALVLVTANVKDFARFDGLVVGNWLTSR